jgi:hypothetical protein
VIALAFSASPIEAAGPKKVTTIITGSITKSNLTSGACGGVSDANGTDSYDTICGNSGSCQCLSAASLTLAGNFGKGTANLSVTVDENSNAVTGQDVNACAPAFGVFTLSIPARGKLSASTQTLNAMGAVCGSAGTTTVVALGGFSIEGSTTKSTGSGTFNGTVSTVGAVSIKLVGLITTP